MVYAIFSRPLGKVLAPAKQFNKPIVSLIFRLLWLCCPTAII